MKVNRDRARKRMGGAEGVGGTEECGPPVQIRCRFRCYRCCGAVQSSAFYPCLRGLPGIAAGNGEINPRSDPESAQNAYYLWVMDQIFFEDSVPELVEHRGGCVRSVPLIPGFPGSLPGRGSTPSGSLIRSKNSPRGFGGERGTKGRVATVLNAHPAPWK